jgi:hypothetical protein
VGSLFYSENGCGTEFAKLFSFEVYLITQCPITGTVVKSQLKGMYNLSIVRLFHVLSSLWKDQRRGEGSLFDLSVTFRS